MSPFTAALPSFYAGCTNALRSHSDLVLTPIQRDPLRVDSSHYRCVNAPTPQKAGFHLNVRRVF